MDDFEPQSAQARAHQDYIDATDALEEAKESGDAALIRRAERHAHAAKREWHRLVQLAEQALHKRSGNDANWDSPDL